MMTAGSPFSRSQQSSVRAKAKLVCFAFALMGLLQLATTTSVMAFQSPVPSFRKLQQPKSTTAATALFAGAEKAKEHSLLQEFSIATGEVINPYEILKVSRRAERPEVRAQYIELSRRYHPDAMRRDGILPGSCNNLNEVREHWERIKLAYEILSDPKRRKRYDRHEVLADPGQAVQRAAVDAAFNGVTGVGKGIFNMGAFAVQTIAKQARAANSNSRNETMHQPQQDTLRP